MIAYAIRRLLALPPLLLVVYAAAVLLILAAPGDGLESGARDLSPEVLEQRRKAFNFDQHWAVRCFWTWPRRLIWDGDLPAMRYDDWTVVEILRAALPVSLQLGALALCLSVLIGVGAGVLSALYRGRWLDHVATGLSLIGVSLPTFVTGAGLLILGGIWLRAVPVGGWGRPEQAVLPALTLALPYAAYIARLLRGALLDALNEDYVRTARACGLGPWRVVVDHALRAAMLPVLSYLGPAAAAIFTGSFVVERVFMIPGMGTHVVESILNRDQTLILATVLVYSTLLAGFNLVVDLLYGVLDPRIRVGASSP